MAAFFVCALFALVIIKPQEFMESLLGLPLLYILFGLSIAAVLVDVIWKRLKLSLAPQVPIAIAFLLWALLVTALKSPESLEKESIAMLILFGIFIAVALGMGSPRGMMWFARVFVACALAVTAVGLIQGFRPKGCVVGAPNDWEGLGELRFDGRYCESVHECTHRAPDPRASYRCEHVGPWNTTSIGGRVRYRGSLADPNELALASSIALPFTFALLERQRRRTTRASPALCKKRYAAELPLLLTDRALERVGAFVRAIPSASVVFAVGVLVILSQSRGGVLVFLTVMGIQALRKLGFLGLILGSACAPVLLLLGGRSGSEAESSSDARIELLREGFEMIRETKGIGLGAGTFADESSVGQTAHNAFILAAAETGLMGVCLFCLLLYVSLKVALWIWFGNYRVEPWLWRLAPAVVISLVGACVGIVFLSWTYKDILFILLGASSALYSAARTQDESLRVTISAREVAFVGAFTMALLLGLNVAVRLSN